MPALQQTNHITQAQIRQVTETLLELGNKADEIQLKYRKAKTQEDLNGMCQEIRQAFGDLSGVEIAAMGRIMAEHGEAFSMLGNMLRGR